MYSPMKTTEERKEMGKTRDMNGRGEGCKTRKGEVFLQVYTYASYNYVGESAMLNLMSVASAGALWQISKL